MADVPGKLLDIGLAPLAALRPLLTFTPRNSSGDGASIGDGLLFASRPVTVTPAADGSFVAKLAPTLGLRPDTWYELSVSWLEPSQGFADAALPGFKLRVPDEGGPLSELLDARLTSGQIGFGVGAPDDDDDEADLFAWWVDLSTNPPTLYERSA